MTEPFNHVESYGQDEPQVIDLGSCFFFLVIPTNHMPLITAVRINAPEYPKDVIKVRQHCEKREAHPVLGYYYKGI